MILMFLTNGDHHVHGSCDVGDDGKSDRGDEDQQQWQDRVGDGDADVDVDDGDDR